MGPLYEKYRPRTWDDLCGQDHVRKTIDLVRRTEGLQGQVFWLTSRSGQGKGCIARLIAEEIADLYAIEQINATRLNSETLRDWDRRCSIRPIGKGCHVFIVDEAHNLKSHIVEELQTVLESYHVQKTSTWIFTTTIAGEAVLFDKHMSAGAFFSRAKAVELKHGPELELSFAMRARFIAQQEQLDGKPLDAYVKLVRACECNMRKVIQEIATGSMI
jgi:replication-associated recombination protein RarA